MGRYERPRTGRLDRTSQAALASPTQAELDRDRAPRPKPPTLQEKTDRERRTSREPDLELEDDPLADRQIRDELRGHPLWQSRGRKR
jgi:hypothetical protein